MFKRTLLVYLAGGALSFGLISCGSQNNPSLSQPQQAGATPSTVTVTISANSATGQPMYVPDPATINAGDSVQWVNHDTISPHSATAQDGSWDTGAIQPGATSSPVPFQSPGVSPYYDSYSSATGTVQINASPSPSPSATPSVSPSASPSPSPSATVTPAPTLTATPIPTSTIIK